MGWSRVSAGVEDTTRQGSLLEESQHFREVGKTSMEGATDEVSSFDREENSFDKRG